MTLSLRLERLEQQMQNMARALHDLESALRVSEYLPRRTIAVEPHTVEYIRWFGHMEHCEDCRKEACPVAHTLLEAIPEEDRPTAFG